MRFSFRTAWPRLLFVVSLWPLQAPATDVVDCVPPATVSAEDLIRIALDCNAGLKNLTHQHDALVELAPVAGALDDAMASYALAPLTLGDDFERGQILEFSQAVPWPGKRALRRHRADAQAMAAGEAVSVGQVRLAHAMRMAFAQWAWVGELTALNARHTALWDEFTAVAQARYAAGRGPRHDVLQSSGEARLLVREALDLNSREIAARAQLNQLLNRDPEAPLGAVDALLPVATGVAILEVERHPEIRRIRALERSAESEVALSKKDFLPDFKLMTRYNSLWGDGDQRWMVGIGVNLPLDRDKRRSRLDGAKSRRLALEWQRRDAANHLAEQVVRSRAALESARDIVALYADDLVPLARETVDSALDAYRSGSGEFLTLLTAERHLLDVQRQAAGATRELRLREADWLMGLGLVWPTGK